MKGSEVKGNLLSDSLFLNPGDYIFTSQGKRRCLQRSVPNAGRNLNSGEEMISPGGRHLAAWGNLLQITAMTSHCTLSKSNV